MGMAKRAGLDNAIVHSEIQRSYYTYTVSIDLDCVGVDGEISVPQNEKSDRVKTLLDGIEYLYRDIKGRRENMSPLFIIGGCYERKNPFFENQIKLDNNKLVVKRLAEIVAQSEDIKANTVVGVAADTFENDTEIREKLNADTIGKAFEQLKKEVDKYYGESN